MLLKLDGEKVKEIPQFRFSNEREIQKIVEENLEEVFGLEFVRSEVSIKNVRFDILAFDKQAKAFVIIELKNTANLSVIDQGMAYLATLTERKADIIVLYQESKGATLGRNEINWGDSKVMFISPEYTAYQKMLPNFKDLPIELWEIKKYGKDIILLNQIEKSEESLIGEIATKSAVVKRVSKEITSYNEEYHLNKVLAEDVKDAYYKIKVALTGQDLTVNIQKYYISFKKGRNIAYLHNFSKRKFSIVIMLPYIEGLKLIKHYKINKLSKGVQNFYNGACFEVYIEDNKNLDEINNAIEEAAKKHDN